MNDKEHDNVVGRLGSTNHDESGDKIMCSMSAETGGDEPSSYDSEEQDQGFLYNYAATIATLGTAFIATIVISLIISRMWNEDEIKLHVLNSLIKLLQGIARVCGSMAIEYEQLYNEYVNALH
jgi:hypothetical protein